VKDAYAILVDGNINGKSGGEFAKRARVDGIKAPIILVSSDPERYEEYREYFTEMHHKERIVKNLESLLNRIEKLNTTQKA
ncbi:response regulator, partial [Candidatus Woesearchaeota archaeon]